MKKRLNRRSFIKTSGAGLAGLALLPNITDIAFAQSGSTSQRRILPLNHNWLFSDKVLPNGSSPTFNDRSFTRVTIPHTNTLLPWHGFDDKEYEFVSLYRRHFTMPPGLSGRRVFIDFGGVMTAAKVTINGHSLGEYRGGYTPFSFELTPHLNLRGDNVLAIEVDSTERKDIPPFGGDIDYLTFGGIYRDVSLRVVPQTFIENVFAKAAGVMTGDRHVAVQCFLDRVDSGNPLELVAELRDGNKVVASQSTDIGPNDKTINLSLRNLASVELWDSDHPKLYDVTVRLLESNHVIDEYSTRIGFREAKFTPDGFFLNGKHLKLRGLNRHQTFPFVGQAMPARVQRRDAWILRKELKCNIVRTSHYPQSPHFLDACDEYGLMVLEEIPGWQHVGDDQWKDLSVSYVEKMIRRDWNHPSIIIWGV
ncbi:MAG TPA: glycoside hydrolase family 2 TIM barrel-domain containing protein, partial [Pyrinomonadaceae bacterium]